jgi:hypothetical protein
MRRYFINDTDVRRPIINPVVPKPIIPLTKKPFVRYGGGGGGRGGGGYTAAAPVERWQDFLSGMNWKI